MSDDPIPDLAKSEDAATLGLRGKPVAGLDAGRPRRVAPKKSRDSNLAFDIHSGRALQVVANPLIYPWSTVALLRIKFEKGQVGHGTGWFFSPNRIATAAHNLHHPEYGRAETMDILAGWDGQNALEEFSVSAKVIAPGWTEGFSEVNDWAIIATDRAPAAKLGYLGYRSFDQGYPMGLNLFVSGFPADEYGVLPFGARITTSNQFWDSGGVAAVLPKIINYTIATAAGMSGAPVFFWENNGGFSIGIHTQGKGATNAGRRIDDALKDTLDSYWA